MTFAKLIKEDEDGTTILINNKDYEEYLEVLIEWLEENPEGVKKKNIKSKIELPKEINLKKIVLTKEKLFEEK